MQILHLPDGFLTTTRLLIQSVLFAAGVMMPFFCRKDIASGSTIHLDLIGLYSRIIAANIAELKQQCWKMLLLNVVV
ncbi:hypothetical protein Y1Q_0001472 [Alligator mississippiensis]|uniref:Uncharacterized protein n=1 Tax=Alligator mississippiensis TaxID=8496 RepID=A0A151M9P9_ALLMI|nr:hypothetical protein Y1Q_0001472 [Alligator mississippiensis]